MRNLLFIGLNGYAGSGKDTVAKMLKVILNNQGKWDKWEDAYEHYNKYYSNNQGIKYATFLDANVDNKHVYTIAFADQLKSICSAMFGVPLEMFYYNKDNCWVNVNGDFSFVEKKPLWDERIITAAQYYYHNDEYVNSSEKYWMTVRELVVYVGTYLCQNFINYETFVNIVNNKIEEHRLENRDLKYAIVTDVRFTHELEFIRKKHGVLINIVRDSIQQMDNIAEHDLDEVSDYTFTIFNNGSYEELFKDVWELVQHNVVFTNNVIELPARYNLNNYIRLLGESKSNQMWNLCTEGGTLRISEQEGKIQMIDPEGGPYMTIDNVINGTNLILREIAFDEVVGWTLTTEQQS